METPQVLLDHHLKVLRLPTFLREYDKMAQPCAAEGADHPRYLTGKRLVKHARYYWLMLAEGHLPRRLFEAMVRRMGALPVPGG